jgi:hypothetical protein
MSIFVEGLWRLLVAIRCLLHQNKLFLPLLNRWAVAAKLSLSEALIANTCCLKSNE